ncbi:MAG: alpha-L-arabinofuranosidase [Anaerolineae bacterium]
MRAAASASDITVYDDQLSPSWQNWSWNATINFANTTPVYDGSRSIAVQLDGWGGLSLRTSPPVQMSTHPTLTLWIHGGSGADKQLRVYIQETDGGPAVGIYPITATAGTWTLIAVDVRDLEYPSQVARITIQDRTGTNQGQFYVDRITFVAGTPPPPPTLPGIDATVRIQASSPITPFTPHMLASNLPAWLGPTRLDDATFRARTAASGLKLLRLPGGSWSNAYGWASCELGSDVPNAVPCYWTWAAKPTDFINFLKATNTEAIWVVSPNGTSKEAAAAVAFFNGHVDDTRTIGVDIRGTNWYTVGHWAQLRASHGNPDPIGIKLWEFGNEMYASKSSTASPSSSSLCQPWGWEDTWTCDGFEYVNGVGSGSSRKEGYLEFRAAMQAVDPTITLMAVGYEDPGQTTHDRSNWWSYAGWGSRVISAAGSNLDWYSIHPYPYFNLPSSMANALANPQSHWPAIVNQIRTAFNTYAGGRQAPIAATEFNLVSVQDQDNGQWMTRVVNMLFLADSIGQAAQQGVTLFAQWDLANGRAWNGTEYGLMHEDNGYYRAPQYYVYPLWSRFGSQMLPVTSTLDAAAQLSVYAGRVNSTTVSLLAINKTGAPITATVEVDGFGPLIGGVMYEAHGLSLAAQSVTYNGVVNPSDALSEPPTSFAASGSAVTRVLAPYSVSLLHLQQVPSPTATPTATSTAPSPTATPTAPLPPPRAYLPIIRRP